MIDLREIEETIEQLKREGSTVAQAQKLALLYIARDHMLEEDAKTAPVIPAASYAAAPPDLADDAPVVPDYTEDASEFLQACAGRDVRDVLGVVDQHMEAIRIVYPKQYAIILQMLAEIR